QTELMSDRTLLVIWMPYPDGVIRIVLQASEVDLHTVLALVPKDVMNTFRQSAMREHPASQIGCDAVLPVHSPHRIVEARPPSRRGVVGGHVFFRQRYDGGTALCGRTLEMLDARSSEITGLLQAGARQNMRSLQILNAHLED
ncbi:MAG TPA: hypothetical protein VIU14_06900, partial [Mesorhizobium sp.]